MAVLDNARHEVFAHGLAKGLSQREAYYAAGYAPETDKSADEAACRLANEVKVQSRFEELQREAALAVGVTVQAVSAELSKIAFADIRKAVRWGRSPIDKDSKQANPNGLGIYPVELVPSDEMDDDTAIAVSEVSLTQTGVKIKMHDKRAALVDLGKHLGMFKERVEHTGKDGGPLIEPTDSADLARRIAFLLAQGAAKTEG